LGSRATMALMVGSSKLINNQLATSGSQVTRIFLGVRLAGGVMGSVLKVRILQELDDHQI